MAVNTISKVAGVTLSGSTNNEVVTVTGGNSLTGESNLTFDGSTLTVTGDISHSGNYTNTALPAFNVSHSGSTNITGDDTYYTVAWDAEIFDQGNDFASNTFTAPVTGRYQLNAHFFYAGVDTSVTFLQLRLNTSNRVYINQVSNTGNYFAETISVSVLADMDAADTATVICRAGGGTKTVDLTTDPTYHSFSGFLVC